MADSRWFKCLHCKSSTRHTIVATHDEIEYTGGGEDEAPDAYYNTYEILKCNGCDSVSFCHTGKYGFDEEIPTVEIYPKRNSETRSIKTYSVDMGKTIQTIYRQTIDAYNAGLYYLCAAGLRALIEAICAEKNITDGPIYDTDGKATLDSAGKQIRRKDLEAKINGLAERGFVAIESARIFHANRYMGNDALHKLVEPSRENLEAGLAIVEHILDTIFVIPLMGKPKGTKFGKQL